MPDSNSDILKNPYSRRKFYATCLAATVALVCLRYFVLPAIYRGQAGADVSPYSAISSLLDNFIVALISSIVVTVLLLWLSPSVKEMAEITVIKPGRELKSILNEDVKNSSEFWYRGHTAKWTRTVTVPALAKEAREERATKKIYIIVLDPDNESSCRLLADLDHHRNPTVAIPDRLKFIKRELMVTILTVYLWKEREPLLDIHVSLNNKFSLFRIDLYSKSAIVTRSSPNESALRYSSTSDFYRAFRQELHISFQQAKQLPEIDAEGVTFDNLTVEAARNLLVKIGINTAAVTDDELQTAVNEIKYPEPPY
jgi:hypothetical protein